MSLRNGTIYETERKKMLEQFDDVLNLAQNELICLGSMEIHEVKSCRSDRFRLSHPREKAQLMKLLSYVDLGWKIFYDIKFLGHGWRSVEISGMFTSIDAHGDIHVGRELTPKRMPEGVPPRVMR